MVSVAFSHRMRQPDPAVGSIGELLATSVHRHPRQIAFRFENRTWTYAELDRVTDAVARGLRARGIGCGDRVAFLLPNGPELVCLDLACLKIRAIAVPLNVRLKSAELEYILDHCRARLCVVHADLYENLAPARANLAHLESVVVAGNAGVFAGCKPFAALLKHRTEAVGAAPARANDVAAILYTSGTTARPKGVTHTHGTLASTVRNYAQAVRLSEACTASDPGRNGRRLRDVEGRCRLVGAGAAAVCHRADRRVQGARARDVSR